jgi:hypothetical protein
MMRLICCRILKGWQLALLSAGCGCLTVMVLTHVAERLHILPGMGWGLPDSPGHYLDLVSAIAGIALLLTSYVLAKRKGRRRR